MNLKSFIFALVLEKLMEYSSLNRKVLSVIIGVFVISVFGLVLMRFLAPESKVKKKEKTLDYPKSQVWEAVSNPLHYLLSKEKEISKYTIYDTVMPHWVEYYNPKDSVIHKCIESNGSNRIVYELINPKYEEFHKSTVILDSINPSQTKVVIEEISDYKNIWAKVYFNLLHPNTFIDFEFLKLENSLSQLNQKDE